MSHSNPFASPASWPFAVITSFFRCPESPDVDNGQFTSRNQACRPPRPLHRSRSTGVVPQGVHRIRSRYLSSPYKATVITADAHSWADDLAALERGQDLVRMVIPDIVNAVYKKLLKHDVTARVFSTHDSRDDEDPPVWPQDGSPAIQNRKIFLRWYLTRLNQDPSKKEFVCFTPFVFTVLRHSLTICI
jgi:hypothetical protein